MSNQYYGNDDLELKVGGVSYKVNVSAYGTYTYSKATMYEPEDSDFVIDEVEAIWTDENGNVVEETEEMKDVLEEYLYSDDGWDDDYPELPDDYYEERAMARWERELDRYDL